MNFNWIDDIGSMLVAITATGKIVAVNNQFCRVSRYSSSESCGLDLGNLFEDPDGEVGSFIFGSLTVESNTSISSVKLIDKIGRKWPVVGTVIRIEEQNSALFLFFCRMKADTHRLACEFNSGFRDFQTKTLGRMAEGLVYDFRNIFGIVTGYTEMVREGLPQDDEKRNDLEEVLAACGRGKKLLNNINVFFKTTQVGDVSLDAERGIGMMIEKVKSVLPPKTTLSYSSSIKKTSIKVDPVKLEQLLVGICLALCDYGKLHFSPTDMTISISVDNKGSDDIFRGETPAEKKWVQILIQSAAIQLDRNSVDQFNRWSEQLYCNINELCSFLDNCRRILIELNGQLKLNYYTDQPAISILFPIVDKSVIGKPVYAGPPCGKGQLVLVVDDEIQVADLTGRRLEKMGYRVVKKNSSIEALKYFSTHFQVFSLLIIDQVMPELAGLEFAREAKKIHPQIPIVMMTGYSSGITEKKCNEYGIKSLVMKPIDEKELAAIVAFALR